MLAYLIYLPTLSHIIFSQNENKSLRMLYSPTLYLTNRRHLQRRSSVNAMTLWNKLLRKISQWPIQLIHHMNCWLQYHDSDLVFHRDKTSQNCHNLFDKLIYEIEKPSMSADIDEFIILSMTMWPLAFMYIFWHLYFTVFTLNPEKNFENDFLRWNDLWAISVTSF